jgi:hypothetical protein
VKSIHLKATLFNFVHPSVTFPLSKPNILLSIVLSIHMSSAVFMAVRVQMWSSGLYHRVVLLVVTNVSEEDTASIFRMQVLGNYQQDYKVSQPRRQPESSIYVHPLRTDTKFHTNIKQKVKLRIYINKLYIIIYMDTLCVILRDLDGKINHLKLNCSIHPPNLKSREIKEEGKSAETVKLKENARSNYNYESRCIGQVIILISVRHCFEELSLFVYHKHLSHDLKALEISTSTSDFQSYLH